MSAKLNEIICDECKKPLGVTESVQTWYEYAFHGNAKTVEKGIHIACKNKRERDQLCVGCDEPIDDKPFVISSSMYGSTIRHIDCHLKGVYWGKRHMDQLQKENEEFETKAAK